MSPSTPVSALHWPRLEPVEIARLRRRPVDPETLAGAARLIAEVEAGGEQALRALAERLDGLTAEAPLLVDRAGLETALEQMPQAERAVLERTADRIQHFAAAQREALCDVDVPVPGGRAGHRVAPVQAAGCYAPGGRYPLPSSVLMTAITGRVAGVGRVWVASPRPAPATLAAAALAGADGLLAAGGAQAVAALAFGTGGVDPCDVVVGPGNRWVTAAKQLLAGRIGIDMLAGPSELVILADASADPSMAAADLLAQAEHDPDALPVLVTTCSRLATEVETELTRQLEDLPTRKVALLALAGGFQVHCQDLDEAIAVCDRLAPEHLQVMTHQPEAVAARLRSYGALFIGPMSAEVLGDYGAGPNHTLPTGGGARFAGGLSVLDFLRVRTWLHLERTEGIDRLAGDAAALARIEGLEAHARAAERRRGRPLRM